MSTRSRHSSVCTAEHLRASRLANTALALDGGVMGRGVLKCKSPNREQLALPSAGAEWSQPGRFSQRTTHLPSRLDSSVLSPFRRP